MFLSCYFATGSCYNLVIFCYYLILSSYILWNSEQIQLKSLQLIMIHGNHVATFRLSYKQFKLNFGQVLQPNSDVL